jgi:hypothetical protein
VVVSTWPSTRSDEPSTGGSLMGLFLGGISWGGGGVSSSQARWAPMLGFDSWGLANPNTRVTEMKVTEMEQDTW